MRRKNIYLESLLQEEEKEPIDLYADLHVQKGGEDSKPLQDWIDEHNKKAFRYPLDELIKAIEELNRNILNIEPSTWTCNEFEIHVDEANIKVKTTAEVYDMKVSQS